MTVPALHGVRVVELGQAISAPHCAQILVVTDLVHAGRDPLTTVVMRSGRQLHVPGPERA